MTGWAPADLGKVGRTDELHVSSIRPDGSDRPFVTIWAVRAGEHVYVRSAYGADNPWYRRAVRSGAGRVRVGGVDQPVTFTRIDPADTAVQDAVDAAYHAKYDRYGARIVGSVVGDVARRSTLRLDPR
jgi:hypothetical protein